MKTTLVWNEMEIYNYTIEKCIETNIVPTWNVLFRNRYINRSISIYTNLNQILC